MPFLPAVVGPLSSSGDRGRFRVHHPFYTAKKSGSLTLGKITGDGFDLLDHSLANIPTWAVQLWKPNKVFGLPTVQAGVEDRNRQVAQSRLEDISEFFDNRAVVLLFAAGGNKVRIKGNGGREPLAVLLTLHDVLHGVADRPLEPKVQRPMLLWIVVAK